MTIHPSKGFPSSIRIDCVKSSTHVSVIPKPQLTLKHSGWEPMCLCLEEAEKSEKGRTFESCYKCSSMAQNGTAENGDSRDASITPPPLPQPLKISQVPHTK
ncbi:hypothetical protein DNTS_005780, partial [Danionella cerebrum]